MCVFTMKRIAEVTEHSTRYSVCIYVCVYQIEQTLLFVFQGSLFNFSFLMTYIGGHLGEKLNSEKRIAYRL